MFRKDIAEMRDLYTTSIFLIYMFHIIQIHLSSFLPRAPVATYQRPRRVGLRRGLLTGHYSS